ncbi:hypothetical protein SLEP1_g52942 [Rubroshorea leprosula]|uniref:Uncharacterized protein n=1 Tax=Rubroshorea leprosula TaxID=152421 RepID=A0AAV5M8Z4_9ROSI|nr:hypothetical protein SLEP1_g52942 [Rubroshorea leprosula]
MLFIYISSIHKQKGSATQIVEPKGCFQETRFPELVN